MAVTVTAGRSMLPNIQTKHISTQAKWLLKDFAEDFRRIGERNVKLVRAFAEGTHPCWQFNSVFTFVLWGNCTAVKNKALR